MSNRNRKQVKTYDIKLPGWLGLVSLVSYTAAVLFAPLADPAYSWLAQPVRDLSAAGAPSLQLWNQLSCLYGPCALISMMAVTIHVYPNRRKLFKTGVYLFTIMEVLCSISFTMPEAFRPQLSLGALVVSVLGLGAMALDLQKDEFHGLKRYAFIAFVLVLAGGVGGYVLPASATGIPDRLIGFVQAGYNAVIGVYLARGWLDE